VGAFSHKFLVALAAKLLIGSKKVSGCKNGTDLLYQAKFCKNRLRGYTVPLSGKFIPKITNFGDLGGCKPTC